MIYILIYVKSECSIEVLYQRDCANNDTKSMDFIHRQKCLNYALILIVISVQGWQSKSDQTKRSPTCLQSNTIPHKPNMGHCNHYYHLDLLGLSIVLSCMGFMYQILFHKIQLLNELNKVMTVVHHLSLVLDNKIVQA